MRPLQPPDSQLSRLAKRDRPLGRDRPGFAIELEKINVRQRTDWSVPQANTWPCCALRSSNRAERQGAHRQGLVGSINGLVK